MASEDDKDIRDASEDAGEHRIVPSTYAGRKLAEAQENGASEAELEAIGADLDRELSKLDPTAELEGSETEEDEAGDDDDVEPPEEDLGGDEDDPDELDFDELEDDDGYPDDDADEADYLAKAGTEQDLNEELGGEVEADPDEDDPPAVVPPSQQTVEADTLLLADREQAKEAALAGLRARAAQQGTAAAAPPPPTPEPEPEEASTPPPELPVAPLSDGEKKPRAKRLWARFLAASLLIVFSVAAATSISILVYLTDIAKGLSDNNAFASLRDQLAHADGGEPQTILIIGSDKRLGPEGAGDPGRSDTTILLRVDPDKDRIALLSIPRDLKVNIPGVGVAKFNEAYSDGGPDKTLRVVQQLTGLDINHVVNINFTGFADAVDAIGGVYVDVDRRYYIPPETGTAEIDIKAGYQLMQGYKALQYVRFRHFDNDLVRSARQQDFLREARQKLPPGTLIKDRTELLKIFTDYTTSDIGDAVPLLELLKTFAAVQSAPVREVHFPAQLGETYVTASDSAVKKAVAQFLDTEGTPGGRPAGQSPPAEEPSGHGGGGDNGGNQNKPNENKPKPDENKPSNDHFVGPPMEDATAQAQASATQLSHVHKHDGKLMLDFPIYYPTRLVPGSMIIRDSRAFPIDGPGNDVYHGYKQVVDVPGSVFGNGLTDEYYGVSGTDWTDVPILQNPSETRTIDGKQYLLFYDGDRLRTVGWKTGKAAYWVNNTLLQSLEEGQMLSIATSMRELDSK
jgi:LCP family protein required for cell wall assembly